MPLKGSSRKRTASSDEVPTLPAYTSPTRPPPVYTSPSSAPVPIASPARRTGAQTLPRTPRHSYRPSASAQSTAAPPRRSGSPSLSPGPGSSPRLPCGSTTAGQQFDALHGPQGTPLAPRPSRSSGEGARAQASGSLRGGAAGAGGAGLRSAGGRNGAASEDEADDDEEDDHDALAPEPVENYREALEEGVLPIHRIDRKRWVIGDYDGTYYFPYRLLHVEGEHEDDVLVTACSCPARDRAELCLHRRAVASAWERLNAEETLSGSMENPDAVAITGDGTADLVSVRAARDPRSRDGKRIFVRRVGADRWLCQSCGPKRAEPAAACVHRGRARIFLRDVLGVQFEEVGEEGAAEEIDGEEDERQLDEAALGAPVTAPRSHRAIHPPRFARLSHEPDAPVKPDTLPPVLPLTADSRCSCGRFARPLRDTRSIPCVIFGSNGPLDWRIEVQRCSCRKRGNRWTIGPDLGDYALFNWSNTIIVTHELLNRCTSQLMRSPTPLSAFTQSTRDAWLEHGIDRKFLSNKTYNAIFYGFIRLQATDVAFSCSRCTDSPKIVLADGVSLAFSSTRLAATLRPPTRPTGPLCPDVRPRRAVAFLPTRETRRAARTVLEAVKSTDLESEAAIAALALLEGYEGSEPDHRAVQAMLHLLRALPELVAHSPHLLALYADFLGQLSTSDSILSIILPSDRLSQLLNIAMTCCISRTVFPAAEATNLARWFPALGALALTYASLQLPPPRMLVGFANIALQRATAASDALKGVHAVAGGQEIDVDNSRESEVGTDPSAWERTGVYYGIPEVRKRPCYPAFKEKGGLPAGEGKEAEEKEERRCRKFYSSYTGQKQTGGIMVLWCRHSICLGFHVIPRGEGRNDVFSALLTRFRVAPEIVVYDFACALGPYCRSREARFFAKTRFVIDHFHASDHTACSTACFASTYAPYCSQMNSINTSAAESGNAALGRIRKTVSYSSQERAVQLTRHFLSIWNRLKLQKLDADM